jgi:nucleotide-binding universal stress UspA family protein
MKKILFAYDGTDQSKLAARSLASHPLPQAEIHCLTVADVWVPPDPVKTPGHELPVISQSRKNARARAADALDAARHISKEGAHLLQELRPSFSIKAIARTGSPAWCIIMEAQQWEADLVVLGSHGKSRVERFVLGSVAQKVSAQVQCSVAILRRVLEFQDDPPRILIAFDGSEDSQAAFNEVCSRPWTRGTQFMVLSVVDTSLRSASLFSGFFNRFRRDAGEDQTIFQMAEAHADLLRKQGFEAQARITSGEAREDILNLAKDFHATDIVVGARGWQTSGAAAYVGSVASALANRSGCNVEIVRRSLKQNATPEDSSGNLSQHHAA